MSPTSKLAVRAASVLATITLFGFPAAAQCESQLDRLIGKDSTEQQFAGRSISMSGTTVVVGANGQISTSYEDYAYVYEVQDGDWPVDLVLLQNPWPDDAGGEEFGTSVAIDGDRIAVGTPRHTNPSIPNSVQEGAIITWERQSGVWVSGALVKSANSRSIDHMGMSVAIQGDLMVAGSPAPEKTFNHPGQAHVFQRQGQFAWPEIATLAASDMGPLDAFGTSVAIDGNTVVVGAINAWNSVGVGSKQSGAAYVFEDNGSGFVEVAKLAPANGDNKDEFGFDVDVSGDRILVGAKDFGSSQGRVYAYHRDAVSGWTLTEELSAGGGNKFGFAVALDGPEAVISAPSENGIGSVYNYSLVGGLWNLDGQIDPPEGSVQDFVGFDLAIDGPACAISAPFDDGNIQQSQNGRGVTYVYALTGPVGLESCPGVPNSTGLPGTLTAHGTDFASEECLTLVVEDLPTNQYGFFLMAPDPGFVPNPGGSDGNLCLGAFLRLKDDVLNSGAGGSVSLTLDFQNLPGGTVIGPGDIWYFQFWYRDGASSNLSNAIEIMFR